MPITLLHGRWGAQKLVVRLPHQQRPHGGHTLWLHLPQEKSAPLIVKQDNAHESLALSPYRRSPRRR